MIRINIRRIIFKLEVTQNVCLDAEKINSLTFSMIFRVKLQNKQVDRYYLMQERTCFFSSGFYPIMSKEPNISVLIANVEHIELKDNINGVSDILEGTRSTMRETRYIFKLNVYEL